MSGWRISARRPRARGETLRGYQGALRGFMDYVTDERYPWVAICEREFGVRPVQILYEEQLDRAVSSSRVARASGRSRARSWSCSLNFCDARVRTLRGCGARGRWRRCATRRCSRRSMHGDLRRQEAAAARSAGFQAQPGAAGVWPLRARWGSGTARRRGVRSAAPAGGVDGVRLVGGGDRAVRRGDPPAYGREDHPALFLTERGGRISSEYVTERFADYRDAAGLPAELTPHSLRRSYVTHLIEDGWDELFVRLQVGHRWASTTAIYTFVSERLQERRDAPRAARQLGGERAGAGRADGDGSTTSGGCGRCWPSAGSTPRRSSRRCLAEHGVRLSDSQVWRLLTGKPERLNLHTLMVLCEILDCTPNDLIERVKATTPARLAKRAAVGESRIADIDPKPARIRGIEPPKKA